MQTETVDAVRGDILDSHGRVLVTNESAYQVSLDSSLMGDARNEILTQLLALCREERVEWTDTFPVTDDSAPYSFTKPDVYTYLYTKRTIRATRSARSSGAPIWGRWRCPISGWMTRWMMSRSRTR